MKHNRISAAQALTPSRALFCLALCAASVSTAQAATYYVSPTGSDANGGTVISRPRRNIKSTVALLQPGDRVVVRRGRYFESNIDLVGKGTPTAPILIQGYPGEEVIVDGGFVDFRTADNADWEHCTDTCDPAKNIYRSARTYPRAAQIGGYFTWQGANYRLVPYKDESSCPNGVSWNGMEYLSSDNHDYDYCKPRYLGPGVYWNESDARIYVRMTPPAATATFREFGLYTDPDPRKIPMAIGSYTIGLSATDAAYVKVSNLKLHHHLFSINGAFSDSLFERLELLPNAIGMRFGEATSGIKVDRVTVDGYLPWWIAWLDIKGGEQYAVRARLSGYQNGGHDIQIINSVFKNLFDGLIITSGQSHDYKILNNQFIGIWDDTMQLGARTYNIEFGYNRIQGAGPSHDGSAAQYLPDYEANIGRKYFHHNVFDNTRKILWGRNDPKRIRDELGLPDGREIGWKSSLLISAHVGKGYMFGDPWKFYNNTFIVSDAVAGHPGTLGLWGNVSTQGIPHELYNNIFKLVDCKTLFTNYSDFGGNEIHDGNIFFKGANNPDAPGNYSFYRASDTHVEATDTGRLSFGASQSFSVSAWVRIEPSSLGVEDRPTIALAAKRAADGTGYMLGVYSSDIYQGKPHIVLRSPTGNATVIGYARVDDGSWHHLTMTVDRASASRTAKLYIDGALRSAAINIASVGDLDVPEGFRVGSNLEGSLSQLQVHGRALGAAEVATLHAGQRLEGLPLWSLESASESGSLTSGFVAPWQTPSLLGRASFEFFGFEGYETMPNLSALLGSDFRFLSSFSYGPSGWGTLGIEADPGLNAEYRPRRSGPASVPGVNLVPRGWPAVSDGGYRGAIRP
jgi:hypothetical protein